MKTRVLYLFFIGLILISCRAKNKDYNENDQFNIQKKETINLSEFADTQCLNLQKYLIAFNQMNSVSTLRVVTTNFAIESDERLSPLLVLKLAAENFDFNYLDKNLISNQFLFEQTDCENIQILTRGHDTEIFKISESSLTEIQFENDSDEKYIFIWQSAQEFKFIHIFKTYDFNCKLNRFEVTLEKTYSWNSKAFDNSLLDAQFISKDYLRQVTEAKVYSVSDLYVLRGSEENEPIEYLKPSVLTELSQRGLKGYELSCE